MSGSKQLSTDSSRVTQYGDENYHQYGELDDRPPRHSYDAQSNATFRPCPLSANTAFKGTVKSARFVYVLLRNLSTTAADLIRQAPHPNNEVN
jgi:hypothetical protein